MYNSDYMKKWQGFDQTNGFLKVEHLVTILKKEKENKPGNANS